MQDLYTTLGILALVSFIIMLIAGASDKIIVYYNFKDLLLTVSPWIVAILTFILIHEYQHEGKLNMDNLSVIQQVIYKTGVTIALVLGLYSIRKSQKNNKSFFLGLIIGVFRLVSSLIAFVILFEQAYTLLRGKTTYREAANAALIIGLFVWIGKKLINGERVYLQKGWNEHQEAEA